MEIIKKDIASIAHNETEGERISLSIARDDEGYFVYSDDCDESDTPHFDTRKACAEYIEHAWASPLWDLQFNA